MPKYKFKNQMRYKIIVKGLKQLLKDLINFPSVTPNEAGSITYIENLLTENGFVTHTQLCGEGARSVTNLYAKYGTTRPNICFAGHVDVVPPGDLNEWDSPPFTATEKDDKIFGRGAVDMKSSIAASLKASIDFINVIKEFKGSISFIITSDEEGPAEFGTKKMLEYLHTQDEKIDLVVLGEPTSDKIFGDQIKICRRGSINFTLTIHGTQGHVAYPEKCINPIDTMIKIGSALINTRIDEGTKYFDPSNLEITSIDVGNSTSNVIPSKVTAKFNIRFNDLHTAATLAQEISELIGSLTKLKHELTYKSSAESFMQEPTGLIKVFGDLIKEKINPDVVYTSTGGTSDARFIHNYCPVVECGPLNDTAHKINEFIENNDLQKLYTMYYHVLERFLGENAQEYVA